MKINSEDDLKEIENEIISNRADALLASNTSQDSGKENNKGNKSNFIEQSSQCKLFKNYI